MSLIRQIEEWFKDHVCASLAPHRRQQAVGPDVEVKNRTLDTATQAKSLERFQLAIQPGGMYERRGTKIIELGHV